MIDYLHKAKTAWHGVNEMKALLDQAGFTPLKEEDSWSLEKGKGYYLERNGRSLAAFRVGSAPLTQYRIIAAHTDSPHLRLKLDSLKRDGTLLVCQTSVYGGPIQNTWLDRPLGVAGMVMVRNRAGQAERYLFDSESPIGIIPNSAIHLNREVNKGFEIKPQQHLSVMLSIEEDFHDYLAAKLGVAKEDILSSELELYLPDAPILLGKNRETSLVSAPRIDNQIHCILGVKGLLEEPGEYTPMGLFFDSEETGSRTLGGANSTFTRHLLERISLAMGQSREDQLRSRGLSLILSADVAHAWNPNFAEKYDPAYKCHLNGGPVIKVDVNNRYATTAETEAAIRLLAERDSIPLQKFIIHSDLPCGSTVGPMLSADTSIPCVDMGVAVWAMHSSCETAGMKDIENMGHIFKVFYNPL